MATRTINNFFCNPISGVCGGSGGGGTSGPQNNFSATSDPTASDDNTAGYSIGSTWINTATDSVFVMTDSSTGAAVWIEVSASTSGTSGIDGSVQFALAGAHGSDATNFFWDNSNKRLGIGTNAPGVDLHVEGDSLTTAFTGFAFTKS